MYKIWRRKPELWVYETVLKQPMNTTEITNVQWKVESDTNIGRKIAPRKPRPGKKYRFLPNNRNVNSRTEFVKGYKMIMYK